MEIKEIDFGGFVVSFFAFASLWKRQKTICHNFFLYEALISFKSHKFAEVFDLFDFLYDSEIKFSHRKLEALNAISLQWRHSESSKIHHRVNAHNRAVNYTIWIKLTSPFKTLKSLIYSTRFNTAHQTQRNYHR